MAFIERRAEALLPPQILASLAVGTTAHIFDHLTGHMRHGFTRYA
jgi:hypothetical protein